MTLFVAYMYHRVLNLTGKLSLFQNLLEKPEEKKNEAALSMIQCKLLPVSWRTLNFSSFYFRYSLFLFFICKETSISTSVLLFSNIERLLKAEDVHNIYIQTHVSFF